ncbi:MAG: DUF1850 domain-containing protein [Synergistaceae bacterium]|jgi:hypothetical protein|nr:DUF1850 domain-containing protein [Synergistaceae bacterium]
MTSDRPRAGERIVRAALIILCMAAYIPSMPVNRFEITDAGGTLYASPVPNGASFVTRYIHSVQLTPVVDDYRFANGRIWGWEERVQSNNAGLPSIPPERGRFIMASPWMIVRGGGESHSVIVHRVGSAEFGLNTWRLLPFGEIRAFERHPYARVRFSCSIAKLKDSPVVGFE